jgi:hypothetical protein
MDIWTELFGTIGWWVLPLMALVWAFREWWERQKNRDQVRFSQLAEMRAQEIQEFYRKLTETEGLLKDWYYLHMPIGIDPPHVDPREVIRRVRDLEETAKRQRLLFGTETRELIDSMCREISEVSRTLEWREMTRGGQSAFSDEEVEREEKALLTLTGTIPNIRERLDQEFRHLLGTSR